MAALAFATASCTNYDELVQSPWTFRVIFLGVLLVVVARLYLRGGRGGGESGKVRDDRRP
jgi:hypothetical protein